jgi:hypothetical protein
MSAIEGYALIFWQYVPKLPERICEYTITKRIGGFVETTPNGWITLFQPPDVRFRANYFDHLMSLNSVASSAAWIPTLKLDCGVFTPTRKGATP